MNWIWLLPAALVAINTLLAAAPATHRRRCAARAELLAKLVAAAGDRCPKVLRAELIEKIHWVAAYRAIHYEGKHRLILWGGWLLSLATLAVAMAAVVVNGGGKPPQSPLMFIGSALAIGSISAIEMIPVAFVMDWMYGRRLMYVRSGGRDDLSDLRFPGLRRRGYSSGAVKLITRQVLGDQKSGEAISSNDGLALRGRPARNCARGDLLLEQQTAGDVVGGHYDEGGRFGRVAHAPWFLSVRVEWSSGLAREVPPVVMSEIGCRLPYFGRSLQRVVFELSGIHGHWAEDLRDSALIDLGIFEKCFCAAADQEGAFNRRGAGGNDLLDCAPQVLFDERTELVGDLVVPQVIGRGRIRLFGLVLVGEDRGESGVQLGELGGEPGDLG